MKRIAAALAAGFVLFLVACGQPLPPDRLSYVGQWESAQMWLVITPDGRCEYERKAGSGSRSIRGPIQRFVGDDFVVGVGPLSTTFKVAHPPRMVEGKWKMTVDGVELTRVGSPGENTA
jgi:hypothetical protein